MNSWEARRLCVLRGIVWLTEPLFSSKNSYLSGMQDVIRGLTRNRTKVILLCAAGRVYLDNHVPTVVLWRGAIDRQVKKRGKSRRYIQSVLLLLCADPAREEKPVPLADCYGVNEPGTSGNILIPLLNTGEKRYQSMKCHQHDCSVHNAFRPEHWCYIRKTWKQPQASLTFMQLFMMFSGKYDNSCVWYSQWRLDWIASLLSNLCVTETKIQHYIFFISYLKGYSLNVQEKQPLEDLLMCLVPTLKTWLSPVLVFMGLYIQLHLHME